MISLAFQALLGQDRNAAADTLTPLLLVAGVLVIAAFLMFSTRRKVARRAEQQPSARQMVQRLRAPRSHDDGHEAQLVETARRLAAQLDGKAQRLEILIRQADERLQALREATARAPSPVSAEPAVPSEPPAAVPPSPPDHDPLTRAVYEHADAGLAPVEIARRLEEQVGKVELILALRRG